MMKNTKKVFSLLLSAAMVLGMSVSSFADSGLTIGSSNENTVEEGLFIASNPVPEKAAEYAIKIFESLTPEDMSILRIGQNMDAIRLAHGFTVENTEIPQYYFPVLEDNTVVGILMVNDHADSYGFQLGTSDFSENLNILETDSQNPAQIVASENAYYSMDKNGVEVLKTLPEISSEILEDEMNEVKNAADTFAEKEVINISSNNVYDATIKEFVPYTLMGKKHTVAYVDNWTYTEGDVLHGTCWASCVGSLVDFYQDGKSNASTADSYRTKANNEQKKNTGSYSATSSEVTKYINKYSDSSISYRTEVPNWATIKSTLLNKTIPSGQKGMPFYSQWDGFSGKSFHAMVVSGYRYEDTKPNDESYYSVYLMDPNEETPQLLQYKDSYTINGKLYSWEGSAR